MTIRRGEDWGEVGPLAAGAPVASGDRELGRLLEAARAGRPVAGPFEAGLGGGDLHRTLGAPDRVVEDLRAGRGLRVPVDAVEVELIDPSGDHRALCAVAHVVVARRARRGGPAWWRGRTVVAMNATHVGDLDLGPRAHPGDGLLDVTDGTLPARDRRRALARAVTGTHVPHPALAERRVRELRLDGLGGATVWVDGDPAGPVTGLHLRVLPDALLVVV